MSASTAIEVSRGGQRLKRKVLVAVVLSAVVPTLVLASVLLVTFLPIGLQILLGLTIIGTLIGAWVLWDLGRILTRSGPGLRQDELDTLMTSYNKMQVTIEQQAAEINTFASRLDVAHKDLESNNARLIELTLKDGITPLYNRRRLLMRLEEEVGRWTKLNRPFSLVVFELWMLRAAANKTDCAAYEAALNAFAESLMIPRCPKGSVIARYDGTRFATLLVETPREAALKFVQTVRETVASTHPNGQQPMALEVGIASSPEDGVDALDLISAADAVLRSALTTK